MNVLFDNITVKKIPFDYFYCMCNFNDSAVIEKLLDWFDSNAPWAIEFLKNISCDYT